MELVPESVQDFVRQGRLICHLDLDAITSQPLYERAIKLRDQQRKRASRYTDQQREERRRRREDRLLDHHPFICVVHDETSPHHWAKLGYSWEASWAVWNQPRKLCIKCQWWPNRLEGCPSMRQYRYCKFMHVCTFVNDEGEACLGVNCRAIDHYLAFWAQNGRPPVWY